MYRFDWFEQKKLATGAGLPRLPLASVHPQVWKLGITSLLTDVSSEMVNAALPIFLVLHLHASPLAYGAVEGIYQGMAVVLLGVVGGAWADRNGRHKATALMGYGISSIAKALLLAFASTVAALAVIVAFDRAGKGLRTAPRDSLISFASAPANLATSFAVHRALDAAGALLGPMLAFALLARFPSDFGPIWATSLVFSVLGVAVLGLLVSDQSPPVSRSASRPPTVRAALSLLREGPFRRLAACAFFLAGATAADGFLYLLLQPKTNLTGGAIPLFYMLTALFYMGLSIPAGALADRWGRRETTLCGYGVLLLGYGTLLAGFRGGLWWFGLLVLLGVYYSATEGVFMAIASTLVPEAVRSTGLALLGTIIGLGKLTSAVTFGWVWQQFGSNAALLAFALALGAALLFSVAMLPGKQARVA